MKPDFDWKDRRIAELETMLATKNIVCLELVRMVANLEERLRNANTERPGRADKAA